MLATSRFLRTAIIVLGLLELLLLIFSLHDNSVPIGQYGFLTEADGVTISAVEPYKPAALAHIEPGDKIIYNTLSLFGRHILTLKEPVSVEEPLTFQLLHKGELRLVTLHAKPMPKVFVRITTIVSSLSAFVFGLIGLILVLFRPSRMTWAFALIAPGMLIPSYFPLIAQHSESLEGICYDIFISVIYAIQVTGMLIFASRFPNDKPVGLARIIDHISIPVGIIIAALYVYVTLTLRFTTFQLPNWAVTSDYISLFLGLAALAALISSYATTKGSARSRLIPVIASFGLLLALGIMQQVIQDISSDYAALFGIFIAYGAAPALVSLAVAYGVIRYKVMDINLLLERTLVFSMLTALLITGFALLEFFVEKLFEGRVADVIQMLVAVIVGASINYTHIKLEHFVKVCFFRQRYAAKKRLHTSAKIIQHAASLKLVEEMLTTDPFEALGLASAAVFKRHENYFERVAAIGWGESTTLIMEQDHYLVTKLQAEKKPFKMADVNWLIDSFPSGLARPTYVIPIIIGEQLEVILLYGEHTTGEDIDHEERKSLQGLAHGAALAYGYLSKEQLSIELIAVKSKVQILEAVNQKLENVILSKDL